MFRPQSGYYWSAVCMALVGLWLLAFLAASIRIAGGKARDPGWRTAAREGAIVVKTVDVPNGGIELRAGDRVVAVDHDKSAGVYGPVLPLARIPIGATYTVKVERKQTTLDTQLRMEQDREVSAMNLAATCLIVVLLYAMAVLIGLLRSDDLTARLAAASFFVGALEMGRPLVLAFPGWNSSTALVAILATTLWRPFHLAIAYDFLSRFPAPIAEGVALRLLRRIFYGVAAVFWMSLNVPLVAQAIGIEAFPGLGLLLAIRPDSSSGAALMAVFEGSSGAAMCLVLVRNYLGQPDADARKRLRWAGLGLACTVFSFLVVVSVRSSVGLWGSTWQTKFLSAADGFEPLLVAFAPILLAYAVVKHRVLGITVVVRLGIQYLLATNVLRLILAAPLLAVLIEIVKNPQRPVPEIFLHVSWRFYLFVALTAAISLRYRNRLRIWIDQKFFRMAYEYEAVLMGIVEKLQTSESMHDVSSAVAEALELTFHPSKLFILYRKQTAGLLTVGFPADSPSALQVRGFLNERIREAALLERSMRTTSELGAVFSTTTSTGLADLTHVLPTPITGSTGELVGVLFLGEKKSEQAYSERDRKLLEAIAGQMARAFEVLTLKDTIREEQKVRVEVLGRLDQQQFQLLYECPACGKCYNSPALRCETDGAELGFTLPVERVIDNKYRLDRRIGSGGMGAVYEAYDLRLNRTVAIKIMTGVLFGNQPALRRFEREARTAAKLNHPNIITIYDFGVLRGGGAYLVMQLIAGRSWRAELDRGRQTVPAHVAGWFDQLCDGMASAHAAGVIHRDLKPENVILSNLESGGEKVTLLDFGLAKMRVEAANPEMELSTKGLILGTFGYMSPEQRMGRAVDARTDIYAASVLVVETLSGVRPPMTGASGEWMHATLRWPSPNFATKQLTALLECCLSEDPAGRIDQIERLHRYLIPLLRDCPPAMWEYRGSSGEETVMK